MKKYIQNFVPKAGAMMFIIFRICQSYISSYLENANRKCKLILKMPIEAFEDQAKGRKNNAKRLILSEPDSSHCNYKQS